jgi:hypothetical protein
MKQKIKNNRGRRMTICMFFIMIFSVMLQAGSAAKKIVTIKITPKFAQAKKGYLQEELEAEARRGYSFDFGSPQDRAQIFQIMTQTFKLPDGKNIDTYIQNLDEIARKIAGASLSDGSEFGGSGGSGTGNGSGTGSTNGSSQGVELQLDQKDLPVDEALQSSLEESKKEEKAPEKELLRPFEYTLDVIALEKVTPEEKNGSDELLLESLMKLMQFSYSDDQTSVKNFWIDENGISTEVPLVVTAQTAAKLKTEPMNVVKPTDGFELVWFVLKDRLIGAVGLNDLFKKRAALRTLLGSEEAHGALKKFIDKELKSVALDALYEKLNDKKEAFLNKWIALFKPCFFDVTLLEKSKIRCMFETILINIVVARRVALTGTSYAITSNHVVKKLLNDFVRPLVLLFKKEELKEDEDSAGAVKSGLMNEQQLLEQKQKKEEEQKRIKSISVGKDYVPELYDRFNRLRIYNDFQKMFEIAGCGAIASYNSQKSDIGKRTFYPLLLWLFNDNKIQSSKDFRDIVKKQALFELQTEDPEIKTILENADLWNAVFDYHMQETKKNRKKEDISVWINKECGSLNKVAELLRVIKRMKNVLSENKDSINSLNALEEELKKITISKDAILSSLKKVMSAENSLGVLDRSVESRIGKIIDTYNKENEKKSIVITFLHDLKRKYTQTKTPVTDMIFAFFTNTLKDPSIKSFQLPQIFYGLNRMPSDIISRLAKVLGKKTDFTQIISADDFNNYMQPYGLLLSVIREGQNKFIELSNALHAMNGGVIKQQALYPESLKTTENKTLVDKGIYKGKLKGLIDALDQKKLQKVRTEIEGYVNADSINPTRNYATNLEFNQLLNSFVANLAQQFMTSYGIFAKVLNDGSATCPEGFNDCLIPALPLSGKESLRNARIYQSFKGQLTQIVAVLNPNNKPIDSVGLKNLNIEVLKSLFDQFLEKVKKTFEDKNFEKYWISSNKQSERVEVLGVIKDYCDGLINNIADLKLQVGSSAQPLPLTTGESTNQGGIIPPPPPPFPGQEVNGGSVPPPPPPPPGF